MNLLDDIVYYRDKIQRLQDAIGRINADLLVAMSELQDAEQGLLNTTADLKTSIKDPDILDRFITDADKSFDGSTKDAVVEYLNELKSIVKGSTVEGDADALYEERKA